MGYSMAADAFPVLYDLSEWFVRLMDGLPPPWVLVPILLVTGFGSVLIHELGHALAARALAGVDLPG